MLLDGHPATSVASNLGLAGVSLLYRWKAKLLRQSGTAAATLENRVRQLEEDLRRVERERDEPCGRRRVGRLMDRFSRRIVGWDLQDHMRESLVLATLRAAIALRRPQPGLIHHTARGGQYAGVEYRKMLARAGMPQSMSRAENCYDNAFMESCFGTIKTELEMEPYPDEHAARKRTTLFCEP